MSSTSANARRAPQQARAERRRAALLEAAADLIGSSGYEAVTMTAIAEHAGASIGTLYDYFPDKPSIAFALMSQYIDEMDALWIAVLEDTGSLDRTALADLFIESTLTFMREHPAYAPLLKAAVAIKRSPARRRQMRMTIARALQSISPHIPAARAYILAEVIVQLIKGLIALYRESEAKDRNELAAEYRKLMRLYLVESL